MRGRFAVIDLGATNTRIAWNFSSARRFLKASMPTSKKYAAHVRNISDFLREKKIQRAVLGIASSYEVRTGKLLGTANLPDYRFRNPAKDFRKYGITISLLNDLELAVFGEAAYGAGRKFRNIALLSIATGSGGAFLKDGELVRGRFNTEIGHQIVELGKIHSTFEEYVSGHAIKSIAKRKPETLPDGYFQRFLPRVAQALANVSLFWTPEAIVLAGPVAMRFAKFLPRLRARLDRMVKVIPPAELRIGSLGENAGLMGGFAWFERKNKLD